MSQQLRVSSLLVSKKSGHASERRGPQKDDAAEDAAQQQEQGKETFVIEELVDTPPKRNTRSRSLTPVRSPAAVAAAAALPAPSPSKRKEPPPADEASDSELVQTPSKKARAAAPPVTEPQVESEPTAAVAAAEEQQSPPPPAPAASTRPPAPVTILARSKRGAAMMAHSLHTAPQPPSALLSSSRRGAVSAAAAAAAAIAAASLSRSPAAPAASSAASTMSDETQMLPPPSFAAPPAVVASAAAAASPATARFTPTAGLVVSPFKSSAELQARLSGLLKGVLPLPVALNTLLAVFHGLDTVLLMERSRGTGGGYPTSWTDSLAGSVQRLHPRSTVNLAMVGQLITLYPRCYQLSESHRVDRFGKLTADWRVAFGDSAALVDLDARRKEIEQRMLQFTYDAHQRYLQRLLQQTQHDALLEPGSTAAMSAAAASGVPSAVSALEAYLSTPLSSLRAWFPSFRPDNSEHVPLPIEHPLPRQALNQMLQRVSHHDSGQGLLDLARRRAPIPANLSLGAEQSGLPNSTSHGGSVGAASSAAASSAAASAAAAVSAAVAAPVPKELSVLNPAALSTFRADLARKEAAQKALHGDPAQREQLRQLHKLRPLYDQINFVVSNTKRYHMPLNELLAKTHPNGDHAAVRSSLATLLSIIPAWARLDLSKPALLASSAHASSSSSASGQGQQREILRVVPATACIDPATGRDKFLPIIEQAVRECQDKSNGQQTSTPATAVPAATPSPQVKQEPWTADAEVSEIVVKREEGVPNSAAVAAASSSLAARARAHFTQQQPQQQPKQQQHRSLGRAAQAALAAKQRAGKQQPASTPSIMVKGLSSMR